MNFKELVVVNLIHVFSLSLDFFDDTFVQREKARECLHPLYFFPQNIYVNTDDNDDRRWISFGGNLVSSEFP